MKRFVPVVAGMLVVAALYAIAHYGAEVMLREHPDGLPLLGIRTVAPISERSQPFK